MALGDIYAVGMAAPRLPGDFRPVPYPRDTGVSSQEMAGTLAPIWARIVARQTCLMTVLLPPMLGPVRRAKLLAPPRWMSLGTKLHPPEGWERPSAPKAPLSASISLGLHQSSGTMLRAQRTSSFAPASTALCQTSWCLQNFARRLLRYSRIVRSTSSSAAVFLARISLTSLVWYLRTACFPFLWEVSSQFLGTSVFSGTSSRSDTHLTPLTALLC